MRRSKLPIEALPTWANLYNVKMIDIQVRKSDCGHGSGIFATTDSKSACQEFVVVPPELVLNMEAVWDFAKADRHLREVLEANGEFTRVSFSSSYSDGDQTLTVSCL